MFQKGNNFELYNIFTKIFSLAEPYSKLWEVFFSECQHAAASSYCGFLPPCLYELHHYYYYFLFCNVVIINYNQHYSCIRCRSVTLADQIGIITDVFSFALFFCRTAR